MTSVAKSAARPRTLGIGPLSRRHSYATQRFLSCNKQDITITAVKHALADAASDPAYAEDPDLPTGWNGTMLQRMMVAKDLPPIERSENPLARLKALCR